MALQWVVLDESASMAAAKKPSATSPTLAAISLSSISTAPPSLPPPEQAPAASEDESSLGTIRGRYVGQIQARIERAWSRPRTAIGAPIFQCQLQIDQDRLGRVGDVTLLNCNGDERWQISLVHAIDAASPLPAPPNPAVFARHVVLEFRAAPYSSSAQADLYEPALAPPLDNRLRVNEADSQTAFRSLREAAQAQTPKVMKLKIEGSKVEVESDRQ